MAEHALPGAGTPASGPARVVGPVPSWPPVINACVCGHGLIEHACESYMHVLTYTSCRVSWWVVVDGEVSVRRCGCQRWEARDDA